MTPTPHDHALQQARADHTAAILTLATILNLQEGE